MGLQHLMELKATFIDFEVEGVNYKAKELTCDEFKLYQKDIVEMKGDKRIYHTENTQEGLIFHALYDDKGNKVFEKKDRILIGQLPQRIIKIIWDNVTEANGMNDTEDKTEKNLKAT